ncbi:cytochrome P450 [Streptomyces xanthophaeus]|uniref:cytochrome P450 n=1 Tax=Streptomyces xanthophaeus TaxID=67385 RepID=UPI000B2152D3|nr:cytochrome P450 [Streptomyces xanthophaeus]
MTVTSSMPRQRSIRAWVSALALPSGQADPYAIYERIAESGPVVQAPWGGVLITGYTQARAVLVDGDAWSVLDDTWRDDHQPAWRSNRALTALAGAAALSPAAAHRRQRRIMGPSFTPRAVEGMRPLVRNSVDRHLDALDRALHEDGDVDFVPLVSDRLPMDLLQHMLGASPADTALWSPLAHQVVAAVELAPAAPALQQAHDAATQISERLEALQHHKSSCPGADLLSQMLTGMSDGTRLEAWEITDNLIFLLSAAADTAGGMISNAVLALCRHPEQATWLRNNPDRIPTAVEELVRWDPPVHLTPRFATADLEIAGMPVTAGEGAHIMLAAANRDPVLLPDPQRLDLTRAPVDHLGFAAGPHYCMGAALARLELSELIQALLERFPNLQLAAPPVYGRRRIVMRSLRSLPVTLTQ